MMKKLISLVVLATFLITNTGFAAELRPASGNTNLAPAVISSSLGDENHKNATIAKVSLEGVLKEALGSMAPEQLNNPTTVIKNLQRFLKDYGEKTLHAPATVHFTGIEKIAPNIYKVTTFVEKEVAHERFKKRTWDGFLLFSTNMDGGFFPITPCTGKELEDVKTAIANNILPVRNVRDRTIIEDYKFQEEYDEEVTEWAHKHIKGIQRINSAYFVRRVLAKAGIIVDDADFGRLTIPTYVIPITPELKGRIEKHVVWVTAENGEREAMSAYSSTSNNARHIYLSEERFKEFTDGDDEVKEKILEGYLPHEIGVSLGCKPLYFEGDLVINEVDNRYYARTPPKDKKYFKVVDLDILAGRDYATGKGAAAETSKVVTLKNGATEVEQLVRETMKLLQALAREKPPIVFYELVMKARDPDHKFFGQLGDDLKALGLVHADGSVVKSVRNIVLSAVEGEGLEMRLVSPIKDSAELTAGTAAPAPKVRRSQDRRGRAQISDSAPMVAPRSSDTGQTTGESLALPSAAGFRNTVGTFTPLFQMRSEEDLGIGDFETMKKMVDFHRETGQNVMQLAPFGISSAFNSPYSVASSRSIDPVYINIEKLFRDLGIMDTPEVKEFFRVNDALIKQLRVNNKVDYDKVRELKMQAFQIAWQLFLDQPRNNLHTGFKKYMRDNKDWLEDHMLYLTLKEVHMAEEKAQQIHWTKGKKWDWRTWEAGLRDRDSAVMKAAKEKYNAQILFKSFLQYAANKQFNDLREYGKEKGVEFMVDIPFALDGADVWMNPKLFGLEKANGYKRIATQGVPYEPAYPAGQYWQFYPYDWSNPDTVKYVLDMFRFYQTRASYIRLDHVLGHYRTYLFTEDVDAKMTLKALGLFDDVKRLQAEGLAGDDAVKRQKAAAVYNLIKDRLLKMRHSLPPELKGSLYEDSIRLTMNGKGEMSPESMIMVARTVPADQHGKKLPETSRWQRRKVVEQTVFNADVTNGKQQWDFIRVSPCDRDSAPTDAIYQYLFSADVYKDNMAARQDDSIRLAYFKLGLGEAMMSEFLRLAQERGTALICEALGSLPPAIQASIERLGATNYIPLIWGEKPKWGDSANPFHPDNHIQNAFVTYGLHDSATMKKRWEEEIPREDKINLLNASLRAGNWTEEDVIKLTPKVRKTLLRLVYMSKARIAVLTWVDILGLGEEFRFNFPGTESGQWEIKLPEDCTVEKLLAAAKGESSSLRATEAVKLIRSLIDAGKRKGYEISTDGGKKILNVTPEVGGKAVQIRRLNEKPFLITAYIRASERSAKLCVQVPGGDVIEVPMLQAAVNNSSYQHGLPKAVSQWTATFLPEKAGVYRFWVEVGDTRQKSDIGTLVAVEQNADLNPLSPDYALQGMDLAAFGQAAAEGAASKTQPGKSYWDALGVIASDSKLSKGAFSLTDYVKAQHRQYPGSKISRSQARRDLRELFRRDLLTMDISGNAYIYRVKTLTVEDILANWGQVLEGWERKELLKNLINLVTDPKVLKQARREIVVWGEDVVGYEATPNEEMLKKATLKQISARLAELRKGAAGKKGKARTDRVVASGRAIAPQSRPSPIVAPKGDSRGVPNLPVRSLLSELVANKQSKMLINIGGAMATINAKTLWDRIAENPELATELDCIVDIIKSAIYLADMNDKVAKKGFRFVTPTIWVAPAGELWTVLINDKGIFRPVMIKFEMGKLDKVGLLEGNPYGFSTNTLMSGVLTGHPKEMRETEIPAYVKTTPGYGTWLEFLAQQATEGSPRQHPIAAGLEDQLDHRLLNELIAMAFEYQKLWFIGHYIQQDPKTGTYWFGGDKDISFFDVLNELARATQSDLGSFIDELIRRTEAKYPGFKTEMDIKEIMVRLGRMSAHAGVEDGARYIMGAFRKDPKIGNSGLTLIECHETLEQRMHEAIRNEVFKGNTKEFRKWRNSSNRIALEKNMVVQLPTGAGTVGISKGMTFTYSEFAGQAHEIAEMHYPVAARFVFEKAISNRPILMSYSDKNGVKMLRGYGLKVCYDEGKSLLIIESKRDKIRFTFHGWRRALVEKINSRGKTIHSWSYETPFPISNLDIVNDRLFFTASSEYFDYLNKIGIIDYPSEEIIIGKNDLELPAESQQLGIGAGAAADGAAAEEDTRANKQRTFTKRSGAWNALLVIALSKELRDKTFKPVDYLKAHKEVMAIQDDEAYKPVGPEYYFGLEAIIDNPEAVAHGYLEELKGVGILEQVGEAYKVAPLWNEIDAFKAVHSSVNPVRMLYVAIRRAKEIIGQQRRGAELVANLESILGSAVSAGAAAEGDILDRAKKALVSHLIYAHPPRPYGEIPINWLDNSPTENEKFLTILRRAGIIRVYGTEYILTGEGLNLIEPLIQRRKAAAMLAMPAGLDAAAPAAGGAADERPAPEPRAVQQYRVWRIGDDSNYFEITDFGAAVTRFVANGQHVIWQADEGRTVRQENKTLAVGGGIPVMVPGNGRTVGGNMLTQDGRTVNVLNSSLARLVDDSVDPKVKHMLHGVTDKVCWKPVKVSADSITLSITAAEVALDKVDGVKTLADIIGNVEVEQTYSIQGGKLISSLKVTSLSDGRVVLGGGYHPFYQLKDLDKWTIQVLGGAEKLCAKDSTPLPLDAKPEDIAPGSGLDFSTPKPLKAKGNREIVLSGFKNKKVEILLQHKDTHEERRIIFNSEDFLYLLLWVPEKPPAEGVFSIEPLLTPPNGRNMVLSGNKYVQALVLEKKGDTKTVTWEYQFGAPSQTSEPVSKLDSATKELLDAALGLLPQEYIDRGFNIKEFNAEASAVVEPKQKVDFDTRSALIFSEKLTFEDGLGAILPKLANAGIKVVVIATTKRQQDIIDELNKGTPADNRIYYADNVPAAQVTARRELGAARFLYFRNTSEAAVEGIPNISLIAEQIIRLIGKVCNIVDEPLIVQMKKAAEAFAQAA